jgi:uncharacterized membrane-anchored protein YitT (DUF2179 family)
MKLAWTLNKLFMQEGARPLKQQMMDRILEDSKFFVLFFFLVNIASTLMVFALCSFIILSLKTSGLDMETLLMSTGLALFLVSLLVFILSFVELKKKFKIYQQAVAVKSHVTEFDWAAPILDQLELERQKMKRNLINQGG